MCKPFWKVLQKLRGMKPITVYRIITVLYSGVEIRVLSSASFSSHPTRLYYLTKMLIVFCSIGCSKRKERLSFSLKFYRALPQKSTSQTIKCSHHMKYANVSFVRCLLFFVWIIYYSLILGEVNCAPEHDQENDRDNVATITGVCKFSECL